jgi:hypothetical protein
MVKTKQFFLLAFGLWHRVSECVYVIIENDYVKEKKSFVKKVLKSMGK